MKIHNVDGSVALPDGRRNGAQKDLLSMFLTTKMLVSPFSASSDAAAQSLAHHWAGVFFPKQIDDNKARSLLARFSSRLDGDLDWSVTYEQFLVCLSTLNPNGAPGPDGIPVSYWQAAPSECKEALYNFIYNLADGTTPLPDDFNHAFMVFLAKKTT